MTIPRSDAYYMARALQLARFGLCSTHPNPRVGCVLAKEGELIGEGWHRRAGEPHAEVLALRVAGARACGATAYVNLEPCCHRGRTPPCTEALIGVGVARVVTAMLDPNARVAGRGVERLRAAGIEVDVGLMAESARILNRGFVSRMERARPWVTVKAAASLDGRTATRAGDSKWITGGAARADVHRLRARVSAIMTGSGTALADNPALTARTAEATRQPLRVLVDGALAVPPTARLFDNSAQVILATANVIGSVDYPANVHQVRLVGQDTRVDLAALMEHLADRQVNELLVEAGEALNGALLKNRLVDEIVLYLSPKCLGSEALGIFQLPYIDKLHQHIAMTITDVRQVGQDLRITALVERG